MEDTRTRLVAAMQDALQRRGLHGVGLAEILSVAQAPKGVLYHHFPGGKAELAVAAIDATALAFGSALRRLSAREPDPMLALRAWMQGALERLRSSGFERGCPLATVALESGPDDTELRAALSRAFEGLRGQVAQALQAAGYRDAEALAALAVATYEGGLLQARVAQDVTPLRQALESLLTLMSLASPSPGAAA
jgi:TetR/AcrR family transcriptional regulator, lmrAB and yxaGH operons repressor